MGDLVRTPHCEVTATLEILDRFGVQPEHLAKYRATSSYIQRMIAQAIILCREDFFADNQNRIISIDRSRPFNPAEFLDNGWSIEEQDERSLILTKVDLSKVCFEICLKPGESSVKGEEKLRRLKASGHIRLDAKIFQTLWESKELIPESWKEKISGNIRFIYFDGTVLRGPDGSRDVLYLYWRDGQWNWFYDWLEYDWDDDDPSAVLAS